MLLHLYPCFMNFSYVYFSFLLWFSLFASIVFLSLGLIQHVNCCNIKETFDFIRKVDLQSIKQLSANTIFILFTCKYKTTIITKTKTCTLGCNVVSAVSTKPCGHVVGPMETTGKHSTRWHAAETLLCQGYLQTVYSASAQGGTKNKQLPNYH